jgi:hypothetical protein
MHPGITRNIYPSIQRQLGRCGHMALSHNADVNIFRIMRADAWCAHNFTNNTTFLCSSMHDIIRTTETIDTDLIKGEISSPSIHMAQ